jgi:hypothetical protein
MTIYCDIFLREASGNAAMCIEKSIFLCATNILTAKRILFKTTLRELRVSPVSVAVSANKLNREMSEERNNQRSETSSCTRIRRNGICNDRETDGSTEVLNSSYHSYKKYVIMKLFVHIQISVVQRDFHVAT